MIEFVLVVTHVVGVAIGFLTAMMLVSYRRLPKVVAPPARKPRPPHVSYTFTQESGWSVALMVDTDFDILHPAHARKFGMEIVAQASVVDLLRAGEMDKAARLGAQLQSEKKTIEGEVLD